VPTVPRACLLFCFAPPLPPPHAFPSFGVVCAWSDEVSVAGNGCIHPHSVHGIRRHTHANPTCYLCISLFITSVRLCCCHVQVPRVQLSGGPLEELSTRSYAASAVVHHALRRLRYAARGRQGLVMDTAFHLLGEARILLNSRKTHFSGIQFTKAFHQIRCCANENNIYIRCVTLGCDFAGQAVIGALAVWIQNQKKKRAEYTTACAWRLVCINTYNTEVPTDDLRCVPLCNYPHIRFVFQTWHLHC